jgi:methylglyoxal synthase
VFYQIPVNINQASAEAIVARFGVTLEMARWIVENRVKP